MRRWHSFSTGRIGAQLAAQSMRYALFLSGFVNLWSAFHFFIGIVERPTIDSETFVVIEREEILHINGTTLLNRRF